MPILSLTVPDFLRATAMGQAFLPKTRAVKPVPTDYRLKKKRQVPKQWDDWVRRMHLHRLDSVTLYYKGFVAFEMRHDTGMVTVYWTADEDPDCKRWNWMVVEKAPTNLAEWQAALEKWGKRATSLAKGPQK